jgi:hypothetical protein
MALLLFIAIAAVFLLVACVRNLFFGKLRQFPGPIWAAHTDLWRVYQLWTRRMPDTMLQMHEEYGPVVRIGPNDLSFQSADVFNDVYKAGRKFPKSNFYGMSLSQNKYQSGLDLSSDECD